MNLFRTFAPLLVLSSAALCCASTAWAADPPRASGPTIATRTFAAEAARSAPTPRIGREGSIGIGSLRVFAGAKQVSVRRDADGSKTVAASRPLGVAFVGKPAADGSVSAKGFVTSRWTSKSSGASSSISKGESKLRGDVTQTTWTTKSKDETSTGKETAVRGDVQERSRHISMPSSHLDYSVSYAKDPHTGVTKTTSPAGRNGGVREVTRDPQSKLTTAVIRRDGPNKAWQERVTTIKHDGVTGKTTRDSRIQGKFMDSWASHPRDSRDYGE